MLWLNDYSLTMGDYRSEEVAPRSVVRNLCFFSVNQFSSLAWGRFSGVFTGGGYGQHNVSSAVASTAELLRIGRNDAQ
jgi:hypothetical protein